MSLGWLWIASAVAVIGTGFWLGRRFGAATRYEGVGRPYPWWQSGLAFLGDALVLLGLIALLILVMLTFFA